MQPHGLGGSALPSSRGADLSRGADAPAGPAVAGFSAEANRIARMVESVLSGPLQAALEHARHRAADPLSAVAADRALGTALERTYELIKIAGTSDRDCEERSSASALVLLKLGPSMLELRCKLMENQIELVKRRIATLGGQQQPASSESTAPLSTAAGSSGAAGGGGGGNGAAAAEGADGTCNARMCSRLAIMLTQCAVRATLTSPLPAAASIAEEGMLRYLRSGTLRSCARLAVEHQRWFTADTPDSGSSSGSGSSMGPLRAGSNVYSQGGYLKRGAGVAGGSSGAAGAAGAAAATAAATAGAAAGQPPPPKLQPPRALLSPEEWDHAMWLVAMDLHGLVLMPAMDVHKLAVVRRAHAANAHVAAAARQQVGGGQVISDDKDAAAMLYAMKRQQDPPEAAAALLAGGRAGGAAAGGATASSSGGDTTQHQQQPQPQQQQRDLEEALAAELAASGLFDHAVDLALALLQAADAEVRRRSVTVMGGRVAKGLEQGVRLSTRLDNCLAVVDKALVLMLRNLPMCYSRCWRLGGGSSSGAGGSGGGGEMAVSSDMPPPPKVVAAADAAASAVGPRMQWLVLAQMARTLEALGYGSYGSGGAGISGAAGSGGSGGGGAGSGGSGGGHGDALLGWPFEEAARALPLLGYSYPPDGSVEEVDLRAGAAVRPHMELSVTPYVALAELMEWAAAAAAAADCGGGGSCGGGSIWPLAAFAPRATVFELCMRAAGLAAASALKEGAEKSGGAGGKGKAKSKGKGTSTGVSPDLSRGLMAPWLRVFPDFGSGGAGDGGGSTPRSFAKGWVSLEQELGPELCLRSLLAASQATPADLIGSGSAGSGTGSNNNGTSGGTSSGGTSSGGTSSGGTSGSAGDTSGSAGGGISAGGISGGTSSTSADDAAAWLQRRREWWSCVAAAVRLPGLSGRPYREALQEQARLMRGDGGPDGRPWSRDLPQVVCSLLRLELQRPDPVQQRVTAAAAAAAVEGVPKATAATPAATPAVTPAALLAATVAAFKPSLKAAAASPRTAAPLPPPAPPPLLYAFPATPSPDVEAALAAGLLPAVEATLRHAASEKPKGGGGADVVGICGPLQAGRGLVSFERTPAAAVAEMAARCLRLDLVAGLMGHGTDLFKDTSGNPGSCSSSSSSSSSSSGSGKEGDKAKGEKQKAQKQGADGGGGGGAGAADMALPLLWAAQPCALQQQLQLLVFAPPRQVAALVATLGKLLIWSNAPFHKANSIGAVMSESRSFVLRVLKGEAKTEMLVLTELMSSCCQAWPAVVSHLVRHHAGFGGGGSGGGGSGGEGGGGPLVQAAAAVQRAPPPLHQLRRQVSFALHRWLPPLMLTMTNGSSSPVGSVGAVAARRACLGALHAMHALLCAWYAFKKSNILFMSAEYPAASGGGRGGSGALPAAAASAAERARRASAEAVLKQTLVEETSWRQFVGLDASLATLLAGAVDLVLQQTAVNSWCSKSRWGDRAISQEAAAQLTALNREIGRAFLLVAPLAVSLLPGEVAGVLTDADKAEEEWQAMQSRRKSSSSRSRSGGGGSGGGGSRGGRRAAAAAAEDEEEEEDFPSGAARRAVALSRARLGRFFKLPVLLGAVPEAPQHYEFVRYALETMRSHTPTVYGAGGGGKNPDELCIACLGSWGLGHLVAFAGVLESPAGAAMAAAPAAATGTAAAAADAPSAAAAPAAGSNAAVGTEAAGPGGGGGAAGSGEEEQPAAAAAAPGSGKLLGLHACGNPRCLDLEGESEAALVAGMQVCGGCRCVRYCSKDCQEEHWKEGGHKRVCKEGKAHITESRARSRQL